MVGKVKLVGALVVLATLLVPVQGASAADGCGEGWFKQSDGYLTKQTLWEGLGNHNAWIYHSGRVRFCTDNDTFDNDENRRALIGYDSPEYPFQSEIRSNGGYINFCVRQTIEVHMTGISSASSWSIGGGFSKGDPQVSVTYSKETDSATVRVAKNQVCEADKDRILARTSGITVTAENESGRIPWVRLTTTITPKYRYSGATVGDSWSVTEKDLS